ncbi:MAG: GTP cyclohydrolase I FolE2 [Lentisphaerae bacterium]|nr:GTP cyclohydrolase I FolE2 [Lentisphaerota bacterium]
MKDVQNSRDRRKIPIRKVGIKGLRIPVTVMDRANVSQHTVATVSLTVDLPHRFKGTHMSRFVEIITARRGDISVRQIGAVLRETLERFDSETAQIEIRFPYFIQKAAPVSGAKSLMDYECAFLASMAGGEDPHSLDLVLEVRVPAQTLCPCSREISDVGAHNQRSIVTIRARSRALVWLEDLIAIAEAEASAPLYAVLKREDEKRVTELAYSRPRFVEDVVRGVASKLRSDRRITWYEVESENIESIHNHNAYALVVGPDSGPDRPAPVRKRRSRRR